MAVSKRLRYEVLRRDNHACKYCGQSAPDVKLTVDHVVPASLGGSDDSSNLVAACIECNAGKAASNPDAPLVAEVDEKATQWAQAMQIAIERRASELADVRAAVDAFDVAWQQWANGAVERDRNWRSSVERFIATGLDARFLAEAVESAMGNRRLPSKDVWRYFCGICWREIDKLQEMARHCAGLEGREQSDAGASRSEMDVLIDSHNRQLEEEFAYSEARQAVIDRLTWLVSRSDGMQRAVGRVVFNACAEAERIFNYGVPTDEKYDRAHAELSAYVQDAFAKEGVARPPEFDDMAMFDSFTTDLVVALGGDQDVVKFVDHALWSVMPDAHAEWRKRLLEQDEYFEPDEESVEEYATRMALEHFSSSCAPYMHEIGQWRRAKDQADGS